jgi:hypothetical protein
VAQGTFSIGSTTNTEGVWPRGFALSPAYPNPFNREARFTLSLSREEHVAIAIYDVQGHRVAVLHDGPLGPGVHSLTLRGAHLSSGTYFIRAKSHGQTAVRRVTSLR